VRPTIAHHGRRPGLNSSSGAPLFGSSVIRVGAPPRSGRVRRKIHLGELPGPIRRCGAAPKPFTVVAGAWTFRGGVTRADVTSIPENPHARFGWVVEVMRRTAELVPEDLAPRDLSAVFRLAGRPVDWDGSVISQGPNAPREVTPTPMKSPPPARLETGRGKSFPRT